MIREPGGWWAFTGSVSRLDRQIAVLDGVPVLLEHSLGWISLYDGALVRALRVPAENDVVYAVSADARRVAYATKRWANLVIADADGPLRDQGNLPYSPPIGIDLSGDVFVGQRQMFAWLDGDGRLLVECADAPHLRKHISSMSNSFRWVHPAPDRSGLLSVAAFDTVVSDLAPGRAATEYVLLYLIHPDYIALATDGTDPYWEGCRGRHTAVVLGPDTSARYLVGLDRPTIRVMRQKAELLPQDDAYAVYDALHREVARRPGCLLAGHLDLVVGLHRGRLFRERVSTGERDDLGREDRPITDAIPLPGTGNAVLVSRPRYRDPAWIRVA